MSMKMGIMQPYLFPYIGYWQLINAVDEFVVFDDVNYIKKGWINRNNILFNKQKKMITLPVEKSSQNKLINELYIVESKKNEFLGLISNAYSKAPFFETVFPLLSEIIAYKENNLSLYITNSIKMICKYIDIQTSFSVSSEIEKDNKLKGEEKIIEICKKKDSTHYINLIGGQNLYKNENFIENNIELKFIKSFDVKYKQFNNEFEPNLSIIDIMMFNSSDEIKELLNKYELI